MQESNSSALWQRHGANLIGSDQYANQSGVNEPQSPYVAESSSIFSAGIQPRLVALNPSAARVLPLKSFKVKVDIHLTVAFVSIDAEWKFDAPLPGQEQYPPGFVFEMPKQHTSTVTSTTAKVHDGRVFEAQVVEYTGALPGFKSNEGQGMAMAMQLYRDRSGYNPSTFNPELFSFPFHGAKVGERISVHIDMVENLSFNSGFYVLSLPFGFTPANTGVNNNSLAEILDISVTLSVPDFVKFNPFEFSPPLTKVWVSGGGFNFFEDNSQERLPSETQGMEIINLTLDKSTLSTSLSDFEFKYVGSASDISCRSLHSISPSQQIVGSVVKSIEGGVISTFVSPPRPTSEASAYPRDVVFILDRSGSMGFSRIFGHAQDALITGLNELGPNDRFSVCCFDDRQIWFAGCSPTPSEAAMADLMGKLGIQIGAEPGKQQELKSSGSGFTSVVDPYSDSRKYTDRSPQMQEEPSRGTPLCVSSKQDNIQRAIEWVRGVTPGGTTDILTPLKQAFWGLYNSSDLVEGSGQRLKSIFIITDGAVENEREICKFAAQISKFVRVFTFGIGVDCNAYFLRKLASIGRGYADVCMIRDTLTTQMSSLFSHASFPVLKDISIQLITAEGQPLRPGGQLSLIESCPDAPPDLYRHAPVVLSFNYVGKLPQGVSIRVSGSKPNGEKWTTLVSLTLTSNIPLRKVFAQQMVEKLVADSWLADLNTPQGKEIREKCVQLAVAEAIPCPHTQMVAVEYSKDDYNKFMTQNEYQRRANFSLGKHRNYIILGASLVGAAAFGSIVASLAMGGASAAAAGGAEMAAAAGGDVDGSCCECGDGCDCCDGDCCDGVDCSDLADCF